MIIGNDLLVNHLKNLPDLQVGFCNFFNNKFGKPCCFYALTLFMLLVSHRSATSWSYPTNQEFNLKFQVPVNKTNLIQQLIDQVSPQDSSTAVYVSFLQT